MIHYFDTKIAEEHGINAAILFQNLIHWCGVKIANNQVLEDSHAYIYNSVAAWAELFPYLSPKQIRAALQKLEDAKLIVSRSDLNKISYDRTKHYGIHVSVYAIYTKGQINLDKRANQFAEKGEPIPDSKHNNKQDSKHLGTDEPTQQAATTHTKKSNSKLEAKNELEQKLIDYRKEIKKPLKTPRGLGSLVKAIHSAATAWNCSVDKVTDYMMEKEWQSIRPDYANPFVKAQQTGCNTPTPDHPKPRYFTPQPVAAQEEIRAREQASTGLNNLRDLFNQGGV